MSAPPPSPLDGNQVLQHAFDDVNGRLRVDATVSASVGTVTIEDLDGDNLEINPDGSLNVVNTGSTEVEIDAADGDNIAISDGTNTLDVNSDGSINVQIASTGIPKSLYGEVTSIASGVLTNILTFVCPGGVSCILQSVSISGTNIARYRVRINGTTVDQRRTYFGGDLNTTFDFKTISGGSITMITGQLIEIDVIHTRPDVGDFNAKFDYIEV